MIRMENEELQKLQQNLSFIEHQNNAIIDLLYAVLINQGVSEKELNMWVKKENKKINRIFNQK